MDTRPTPNVRAVAPCAGAWIETMSKRPLDTSAHVAPCAGAWIETLSPKDGSDVVVSPPARGRGLKLLIDHLGGYALGRPLRGGVD